MLSVMESQHSPADELPALYRAILDGVAPLERTALRTEALRIRADAAKIYADSWSADGRKALLGLIRRVDRLTLANERTTPPHVAAKPRPANRWGTLRRLVATR
jgi:hypothetical protein